MKLLGIDYGLKNIGLAIASGPLAEPLKNFKLTPKIFDQITLICSSMNIEKIVIGISEGKMAIQTKIFANDLQQRLKIPIEFQDETLTSQYAYQKLKESKAKNKKLKGPKHAFAATLILQEYLDQKNHRINIMI